MSFYGWKPYVPVAQRRAKAAKAAARAAKAGKAYSPVPASRGAIAKTFWGKAWCDNLEAYGDYANRLPRGRTYVRSGAVIDLNLSAGEVKAQVIGSRLYQVAVTVAAVPSEQWTSIVADCADSIDSLVELLQGRLSKPVMARICMQQTGLFPSPKDIKFSCSCPDWAAMCKHVAAVLYGVGARLDVQPELLFQLRRVEAKDLISHAALGGTKAKSTTKRDKVLDDSLLGDVFGIEIDSGGEIAPPPRAKPAATKTAKATRKPEPKAKPAKPGKKKAATPTASNPAAIAGRTKVTRSTAVSGKPASRPKRATNK